MDLNLLLTRLRKEAVAHGDPEMPQEVHAQPWAAVIAAHAQAGQTALLASAANAGGLGPYLVTDDENFVLLCYQRLLGRAPDPDGRAHMLERLRLRAPRTELLMEMALSAEARQLDPGRFLQRGLCRLLQLALHPPFLPTERLVRAVWRRLEKRLARRAHRTPFGLAWQLARAQDTSTQQLQAQLALLEQAQTEFRKQTADQLASQQLALAQEQATDPAQAAELANFFAAFEVAFRGPAHALRAQLEQDYLERLLAVRGAVGSAPCLDLGCGRGVWLGLLRDHGFIGQGVDLNSSAVAEAQAQGLDAKVQDVMEWLQMQPADSALAITAFHLMEHLPFSVRLALVAACARILKPGGLLILETPNPENIWVASHTFHHDPTHTQPLTPDSLEFLVNYHGLETVEVARLHPYPESARLPEVDAVTSRLNNMTCNGQDFVVIAQKPR